MARKFDNQEYTGIVDDAVDLLLGIVEDFSYESERQENTIVAVIKLGGQVAREKGPIVVELLGRPEHSELIKRILDCKDLPSLIDTVLGLQETLEIAVNTSGAKTSLAPRKAVVDIDGMIKTMKIVFEKNKSSVSAEDFMELKKLAMEFAVLIGIKL